MEVKIMLDLDFFFFFFFFFLLFCFPLSLHFSVNLLSFIFFLSRRRLQYNVFIYGRNNSALKLNSLTNYRQLNGLLIVFVKSWDKVSVQRFLDHFKKYGSVDRIPDSGRLRATTLEENEEMIEDLTCSQEENLWTYIIKRDRK